MYLATLISLALSLTTAILAVPTGSDPFSYLQVSIIFHGGPAAYTFNLPADGNSYYTNNPLSVSTIDSSFDIYGRCNFYTTGQKAIVGGVNRGGSLGLGPPQPIIAVACQPTPAPPNYCLPVYATCEWSSQQLGTYLLDCCSGYCAATKCRPTS